MSAEEDYKLLDFGIGFTNMVQRATKGSADLTRKEIKEGSRLLQDKLKQFRPKIAVFNGKLIFEVFSGKKDFNFGRQPECIEGTNTVSGVSLVRYLINLTVMWKKEFNGTSSPTPRNHVFSGARPGRESSAVQFFKNVSHCLRETPNDILSFLSIVHVGDAILERAMRSTTASRR